LENEESDTPAHCAKCEEFMRNPLTSEGYTYVQSALADLPALDSIAKLRAAGRDALADWASWYNFRYWDSEDCEDTGGNRAPGWYSDESF
jgi:phage FluMu gp28-like protein